MDWENISNVWLLLIHDSCLKFRNHDKDKGVFKKLEILFLEEEIIILFFKEINVN